VTAGLELMLEAYPDSARAHRYLGDWYARGKVNDQARRHYEAALARLPSDTSLSAAEKVGMEREIRESMASLGP
jgi:Tfp pilus assembly protein PilF